MVLSPQSQPWTPTKLSGELPFPYGADIEATIAAGIKNLVIPTQIPAYSTIKYCVQYNLDGTQSLFFEVLS